MKTLDKIIRIILIVGLTLITLFAIATTAYIIGCAKESKMMYEDAKSNYQ